MAIMFQLNQATLLSVQLLATCRVFAGVIPVDHRSILVSRGDSVMFTCNISIANATQINWTKGGSIFSYLISQNLTWSPSTSHRLRIDRGLPSKLNIFNAQQDDAGLYKCAVTGGGGEGTAEWNLTVSVKAEENRPSWYFLYILTSAIGILLCGFVTSAVCLSRKCKTRTPNQDPVRDPVQDQFYLESVEEVAVLHPQGGTDSRTSNVQRSQYKERINLIYGL